MVFYDAINKNTNMNADNAFELRILPEERGCYLYVYAFIRSRLRQVSNVTAREKVGRVGKKKF